MLGHDDVLGFGDVLLSICQQVYTAPKPKSSSCAIQTSDLACQGIATLNAGCLEAELLWATWREYELNQTTEIM
jgi:hypothetical protein